MASDRCRLEFFNKQESLTDLIKLVLYTATLTLIFSIAGAGPLQLFLPAMIGITVVLLFALSGMAIGYHLAKEGRIRSARLGYIGGFSGGLFFVLVIAAPHYSIDEAYAWSALGAVAGFLWGLILSTTTLKGKNLMLTGLAD